MIDEFVLSHPVVVLDAHRVEIDDATIKNHVYNICCEKNLSPVPLDVFVHSRSAHLQSMQVELHMARYLPRGLQLDFNSMERRLIEIVLLHRLKGKYVSKQGVVSQAGRAVAVMGTMIQHRLTQLSLSLKIGQHDRVFELGKMPGLSDKLWEIEVLGATAAARVVEAFDKLEGVAVRFPTIHEDVDHGIDLFVEVAPQTDASAQKKLYLAVSIKSVNQKKRLRTEHILLGSSSALFKVFEGARVVSERYMHAFHPVHVLVGRPKHDRPDVCVDETDMLEIERLLDRIEAFGKSPIRQRSVAA